MPGRGLKILIVEDEELHRRAFAEKVLDLPHPLCIDVAKNYQEAMTFIRQAYEEGGLPYDVVATDHNLDPNIDPDFILTGRYVCEALLAVCETAKVPPPLRIGLSSIDAQRGFRDSPGYVTE